MKMDGDIKVRISSRYKQVYDSLCKGIGVDSHVIFFVCFCIAVAKEIPQEPMEKKYEQFWSKTFTPSEWESMRAVILDRNKTNLKSIENAEAVVRTSEELANAGMAYLLDNLTQDCIRNRDGVLSIAVDNKGETIKEIYCLLMNLKEE